MNLHARRARRSPRRLVGGIAVLAAITLAVAGCSTNSGSSSSPSAEASSVVPAKYLSDGLTGGMFCAGGDLSYCDANGTKGKGILAEFAHAWSKELGVKMTVEGSTFEALMPSAVSGRTDLVVGLGDIEDRRAQFTFVDLFTSYYAIIVPAKNPKKVSDATDLCGLSMSTTSASGEETAIKDLSAKCTAKGKPAITIADYGEQAATFLAVQSGRQDATLTDGFSSASLLSQNPGVYKEAFTTEGTTLWAVAVPKSNPKLLAAVKAGVKEALDDGSLAAVLKKYDVDPKILVKKLTVNGVAAS